MSADEKNSLADQAAAWVPPWARQPSPSESGPAPEDAPDPRDGAESPVEAVSPADGRPADAEPVAGTPVEASTDAVVESPVEAVSPADASPVDPEADLEPIDDGGLPAEAEPLVVEAFDTATGTDPVAGVPVDVETAAVAESPYEADLHYESLIEGDPFAESPLGDEPSSTSVESFERGPTVDNSDEGSLASPPESEESDMSGSAETMIDADPLAAGHDVDERLVTGDVSPNGRYGDHLETQLADRQISDSDESDMSGAETAVEAPDVDAVVGEPLLSGEEPQAIAEPLDVATAEPAAGDVAAAGQVLGGVFAGDEAAEEHAASDVTVGAATVGDLAAEAHVAGDVTVGDRVAGEYTADNATVGDEVVAGQVGGEQIALPIEGAPEEVAKVELSDDELRGAVEAILLIVEEPVTEIILAQGLDQPVDRIAGVLERCAREYAEMGRGFELRRIAGGWRLYTRPEYAAYVEKFVLDGQQVRLTQAALETLAVVAYKQPVTRSRISAIRGVNCDGVVRTLVARGLIEECGSEPESGAFLYRTTTLFLEKLGLDSVDELPSLAPFLPDDVDEIADAQR